MRGETLLDPGWTYLNHGAFGACSPAVHAAYLARARDLERQPTGWLVREAPALLAAVRGRLAAFAGAQVDDLVLVPNATYGMNALGRALALRPGDEVLGTDHEYGAVDRMWRSLCERADARWVRVPLPARMREPGEVVERLAATITPRTRALSVPHITSPTALVLPLEAIAELARARDLPLLVDGAHGAGQIPLDLAALAGAGVTAYAATCHKWLCAPKGAGFLWVRPGCHDGVAPPVLGWGEGEPTLAARFEWLGTDDPAAFLAVPEALDEFGAPGAAEARERGRELAARLAEIVGLPPVAGDASWLAQMASVELPTGTDAAALQRELAETHRIEVACPDWGGRPLLRASFASYNDEDDLGRLLDALRALGLGRRKDWSAWHGYYDEPGTELARRLDAVRDRIAHALDGCPPGRVRVLSLCAGEGRDLLPVLASHPRRSDTAAVLVELDQEIAGRARRAAAAAGLGRVDVRDGDAALADVWADAVPADLVLLCGIFGNISDADVARTVAAAPHLCAPGATVIWTRHRHGPDLVPQICAWFEEAGFERVWVSDDGAGYGVGVHRSTAAAPPLEPGTRLFSFVPGRA